MGHPPQSCLTTLLQDASAQQCLAAVQRLLLRPDLTLQVATIFRPLLLRAVARLVQEVCGAAKGQPGPSASPSAEAALALVAILDLAPQCERYAAGPGSWDGRVGNWVFFPL